MYEDFQIATRPMTRDDAFALLVELSRCPVPEECLVELSFETTIARWQIMLIDELDVPQLGKDLNERFGMRVPPAAWHEATTPMKTRTMGDVCELLASHCVVPVIEPITVMGDCSVAAGAFLVVRRLLCDAGVDVTDLRPSSPIGPYLRGRCDEVLWRLRLLSPGRVSQVHVGSPPHDSCALGIASCALGIATSWVALGFGVAGKLPPGGLTVAAVTLVCFWIASRLLRTYVPHPTDVRIGNARCFRELCQVLADERLAWPGFPVRLRGEAPRSLSSR